ncbi:universal stress protein [Gloeobacter kilaueensis]|uniref:Universal stress protein UspA-related nucleotide-binding protein n=1 Tax=Gloeobacter kilaueensis (strain ATCC BAA-2537 / CCAP 1431/1 / ULC 316 / JS1) TaxID=1183438 RepID=U5QJH2_GLOK1|nr:universal stress protein [Gloeobacter kilaueensis]AGY59137.1 universal stress protein UspA-related nucleotide-binding protein [Gloeobacter kilaueensis JS1]
MLLLKNILLAVEDSSAPVQMLKALLDLSGSRGARITALHVVKATPSAQKYDESLLRGREILEKTIAQLALPPEYELRTVLRTGDPKDVVCLVAEETNASLLLMGSRGLNAIVAILKNSVSQYVFQRASCPMLLLRDGFYVNRLRRIAVAVSDTMASKFALKTAVDLARQIEGGQLLLIRVRTRQLDPGETLKVDKPEEESLLLATAAEVARQQGVNYRTLYGVGSPGPEICRLAEENGADLLVLGCQDRRPTIARNLPDLDRLLGNSVSDYVRTNASCPVLLQKTAE